MDELNKVKLLIGIQDNTQDDLLKLIIDNTKSALAVRLNQNDTPRQLIYIVVEVAVKRFNRIKNEGMSSYSQDGESIQFNSNDFDEFAQDIEQFLKSDGAGKPKGAFINPYAI